MAVQGSSLGRRSRGMFKLMKWSIIALFRIFIVTLVSYCRRIMYKRSVLKHFTAFFADYGNRPVAPDVISQLADQLFFFQVRDHQNWHHLHRQFFLLMPLRRSTNGTNGWRSTDRGVDILSAANSTHRKDHKSLARAT